MDNDLAMISNKSPTRLVFQNSAYNCAEIARRSDRLEQQIRVASKAMLWRHVADFKVTHSRLFSGLVPQIPTAVGTYRGAKGTALEFAQREVRHSVVKEGLRPRDRCAVPHTVGPLMVALESDMEQSQDANFTPQEFLICLAGMTHRFFAIHPFLDGNGHVWRAVVMALARYHGWHAKDHWHIHPRPYGPAFSFALQNYREFPQLLEDHFRRYISFA